MNSKPPLVLIRTLSYATAVILVLLPFHAVFTTWLGANFDHSDLFRIWKELILVPLTIGVLWLGWRSKASRQWFKTSNLPRLIIAYLLLNIVLGVVAALRHQVNASALIYALLINCRFMVIFVVGLLLGAHTDWLQTHWRKILLYPALAVVIFGLLQTLILPVNFLSHLGYGPKTIPAFVTVDQKQAYVRIQSTLRGPNPLGAYLLVILTALAGIFFQAKGRVKKCTGLFFTLSGICLLYTYSRSAWLGTAFSFALAAYWSIKNKKVRDRTQAGLAILLVIFAGLIIIFRSNDRLQNTLFHTDEKSVSLESSNQARGQALSDGAKALIKEPLGRGPGTAGPASTRNNHPTRLAENYFIQIGEELGLVGLLIFIAINIQVGQALYRNKQDLLSMILLASLIGLTLVNMLSHAWADDTLALLWWGLAGIALSTSSHLPQRV